MREYIICSAIYYNDGIVHTHKPVNIDTGLVVAGRRHHDCYYILSVLLGDSYNKDCLSRDCQGFLTNTNRFVGRKEAFSIARSASQLRLKYEWDENTILTSEDLY